MISLILNPFDSSHNNAMVLPHNERGDQRHFYSDHNPPPRLTSEAKEWADQNIPGYCVKTGVRGTTFLMEIFFKNDRDAVEFKLRWM
jgi:hypothetical protein